MDPRLDGLALRRHNGCRVMRTIEPKDRVPWPRILAFLTSISQNASCTSSGWTHGEDHGTAAPDARGSTGLYGHAATGHRGHGSPEVHNQRDVHGHIPAECGEVTTQRVHDYHAC